MVLVDMCNQVKKLHQTWQAQSALTKRDYKEKKTKRV